MIDPAIYKPTCEWKKGGLADYEDECGLPAPLYRAMMTHYTYSYDLCDYHANVAKETTRYVVLLASGDGRSLDDA